MMSLGFGFGRFTMNQGAPATVVFPSSFATSPGKRSCRNEQVVGASPFRSVGRATPAHLYEISRRIGLGLTAGTVGANDDGGTRLDEVRHASIPEVNPVEIII